MAAPQTDDQIFGACGDIGCSNEDVAKQLQRILSSLVFRATPMQRKFLSFIVEKTISGETDQIKGYTVATQVFGRKENFDQSTDPVVSIHANKLRRELDFYYLTAGKNDPIRIDIPKGAYVPTFFECAENEFSRPPGIDERLDDTPEAEWPTVLIRPFQNLIGNPELNYIAIGLAYEIALEMTRYRELHVMIYNPAGISSRATDIGVRFCINGCVLKDASGIKVHLDLSDVQKNEQIWADHFFSKFETADIMEFQDNFARIAVAKIAGEAGIIARRMFGESKRRPPNSLRTYDAMLRYYEFTWSFSAEKFHKAHDALKLAVEKEPEFGLSWSMLARLYAMNFCLELTDLETPLEDAFAYAEKGLQLEPANQRTRIIMALVLLYKNELAAGLVEAEKALALNPKSLIFRENIGLVMTLLGDWKGGPALIKQAIEINPYYNRSVHVPLWADCIRRGNYEEAFQEALSLHKSQFFWDPLMKAAASGLKGDRKQGRRAVGDLLALKPGFKTRGRLLIRRLIKFEEIRERIVTGLRICGLEIE